MKATRILSEKNDSSLVLSIPVWAITKKLRPSKKKSRSRASSHKANGKGEKAGHLAPGSLAFRCAALAIGVLRRYRNLLGRYGARACSSPATFLAPRRAQPPGSKRDLPGSKTGCGPGG